MARDTWPAMLMIVWATALRRVPFVPFLRGSFRKPVAGCCGCCLGRWWPRKWSCARGRLSCSGGSFDLASTRKQDGTARRINSSTLYWTFLLSDGTKLTPSGIVVKATSEISCRCIAPLTHWCMSSSGELRDSINTKASIIPRFMRRLS